MDESTILKFRANPLFKGLGNKELHALMLHSRQLFVKRGEILMQEGAPAREFFFILSGAFTVSKKDTVTGTVHTIGALKEGDVIGEIALLDQGTRSATVIANSDAELVSIPFADLNFKESKLINIFIQMAQNVSAKLRRTSSTALEALQKQLDEYKTRSLFVHFFVLIIFFLCAYFYAIAAINAISSLPSSSFYVTLPLTFTFMLGLIFFSRKASLPWETFGVTTKGWKKALYEGIGFTLPLLALFISVKWILLNYWAAHGVVKPLFSLDIHAIRLTIYALVTVPLQELLARGAIQGMLMRFLDGSNKRFMSILVSSILFGTVHLFISFYVACGVLLTSFYLGWLYSRSNTLISPCIAHALLGAWVLEIVGL
jgi:CRP-like cAMP-binding protein